MRYIYLASIVFWNFNAYADVASMCALVAGVGSLYPAYDKFVRDNKEIKLKNINFDVAEDVNHKSAIKVQLVIVYGDNQEDKDCNELYEYLRKKSASEYFSIIEQLKKDHPDRIQVEEYEFTAKRLIKKEEIKYREGKFKPKFALVFAKYLSAGTHKVAVPDDIEEMRVVLAVDDINMQNKLEDAPYLGEDKKDEVANSAAAGAGGTAGADGAGGTGAVKDKLADLKKLTDGKMPDLKKLGDGSNKDSGKDDDDEGFFDAIKDVSSGLFK